MINSITGTIKAVHNGRITVDIGFIGLAVQVPAQGQFQVGQKISLHAHMHWNAEQGPSLFGFASELEKTVFLLVIGCSGMGPKVALAVLSDLGPERFLESIQAGDDRVLSKVSGIGPKKAEQMIVQLRHKVAKLVEQGLNISEGGSVSEWHNVSGVLESLNYSRAEVSGAMRHLRDNYTGVQVPFDQLVRHALSFLSKKP